MTPSPQLIRAVRESRLDIAREYAGLLSELDVKKKLKTSFKLHPFRWIGGAALAGIATSLFGAARPRKTAGRHTDSPSAPLSPPIGIGALSKVGWLAGTLELAKLLYPVLRPLILDFARKSLQRSLSKKSDSLS